LLRGSPTQICWRSLSQLGRRYFGSDVWGHVRQERPDIDSRFSAALSPGSTSDFPLVGHVSTEECMFCCLQTTTQQTIPPWAQCGATNRQGLFTLSSFWEIQPFVTLTCALLCSSLGQKKLGDCMPTSSTRSTRSLSYGPPWAHYLGGYHDRLLGGPLGLPDLRCTAPEGVKHMDHGGEVLG
jgi:hypothetical protein